ncbi:hypothetical protein GUJ93_ZPchr0006g41688 [Zizania palustris]|uniref:Uncharacterized protein n=1 Tax=Zizania palustris TaxID=103762 RepID=A0A8J5SJY2_ZIZPA|nr:hypothetical protein GUJ93_ZPchr0006g41688 [Zizania palustris]
MACSCGLLRPPLPLPSLAHRPRPRDAWGLGAQQIRKAFEEESRADCRAKSGDAPPLACAATGVQCAGLYFSWLWLRLRLRLGGARNMCGMAPQ